MPALRTTHHPFFSKALDTHKQISVAFLPRYSPRSILTSMQPSLLLGAPPSRREVLIGQVNRIHTLNGLPTRRLIKQAQLTVRCSYILSVPWPRQQQCIHPTCAAPGTCPWPPLWRSVSESKAQTVLNLADVLPLSSHSGQD